ncbi:MAG: CapA family protein [Lachnospiraceae bacterium]|nr:CapA family protein [Lachnospiraceae bacterium]
MMFFLGILLIATGCSRRKHEEKNEDNVTVAETESEAVIEPDAESGYINETADTAEDDSISTTERQPDVRTITITATGDCALGPIQTHGYGGSFHAYYDDYGEDYFLEDFKELFENDDFTLVNLECTLTDRAVYVDEESDKEFYIVGRPEYAGILTSSGVEGCSLGNNHTRDVGVEGLEDTEASCDAVGLLWAFNSVTAIYETEDGYKIGFVSSHVSGSVDRENFIRNGIEELKQADVDIIIACCHWGEEKEYYPTDYQIKLAHEFVDLGADLIIGNHPHVVQGVECYNGKVICYSFGNFCFGASHFPFDFNSMVYQQTFTFVDGELQPYIDASVIPICVSSTTETNDFHPVYLNGERKADMLERINTYCEPYGYVRFDENGELYYAEAEDVLKESEQSDEEQSDE